ncbi:MAG: S41 family peptidase [Gemmatimonadales bacterium]|nr:MAG: S41 family peptidase [Gemmatimonadales bacterium]
MPPKRRAERREKITSPRPPVTGQSGPRSGSRDRGNGPSARGLEPETLTDVSRTTGRNVTQSASSLRRSSVFLLLVGLLLGVSTLEAQQFTPFERDQRTQGGQASEESDVFLGALQAISQHALTSHADSVLWEMAIAGLIRELDDPYATVLTPDEVAAFEEESTGNYAGIGVQITELNEQVTITAVFRGTPAEGAGLLVGDRIVGVDEETDRSWTVQDASNRIRGERGTSVRVVVERDGINQPIAFEIERDQVHIPAVTAEKIFEGFDYVHLDRVARNSAAEVDSVLSGLGDSPGLILDLRQNPGGYLDESLRLADLFLERGDPLVRTRSRTPGRSNGLSEETAYSRVTPRIPDVPIIVLVDRFSASASEIIAGALQDHDRAVVLGERTFGKGTVQSVVPLPGGRLIRLTSGEWFTPQGRSLNRPRDREGRVIEPDSVPEFTSRSGRRLLGGGGVFPDLEIAADTFSSEEQRFLTAVAEAEIPLMLRLQEAAFDVAQGARESEVIPDEFPAQRLEDLKAALISEGLPEETITAGVTGYLRYRLEDFLYERLERDDLSIEVKARRDPVLSAAVEFLRSARTQADLFAEVERAGGVGGPAQQASHRER